MPLVLNALLQHLALEACTCKRTMSSYPCMLLFSMVPLTTMWMGDSYACRAAPARNTATAMGRSQQAPWRPENGAVSRSHVHKTTQPCSSDAACFAPAGPLLLNALLQHLGAGGMRPAHADPKAWPAWLPAVGSAAFGYWCAALLGVTSAAKASPCLIPCGGDSSVLFGR